MNTNMLNSIHNELNNKYIYINIFVDVHVD